MVVPDDKLMEETEKIAGKIASKSSVQIEFIKALVNKGIEVDLKKACELTALTATAIPSMLRTGMTEIELMREINHTMKMIGGGFVSFGENASHPHHQCSERKLRKGDFIMADFGCVVNGVGSDITRTFAIGDLDAELRRMYAVVLRANAAGRQAARRRDERRGRDVDPEEQRPSDGVAAEEPRRQEGHHAVERRSSASDDKREWERCA
jgi:hypothetical protein